LNSLSAITAVHPHTEGLIQGRNSGCALAVCWPSVYVLNRTYKPISMRNVARGTEHLRREFEKCPPMDVESTG